jgi:hypothetical protein
VETNSNRPGLANVKLDGRDIIACPVDDIRDEIDPTYFYTFPNGMQGRHKSYGEIIDSVNRTLELIKTEEGHEIFFAR